MILPCVFESDNRRHDDFKPILKCIVQCKGVMVFGGDQFVNKEYGDYKDFLIKYRSLIVELYRNGRVDILNKDTVNKLVDELKKIEPNKDFDDPHIIACVIIGKCQIVCTDDKRAEKNIKDIRFYKVSTQRPSIYKNKKNHLKLLRDCF